ncbi:MAG: asparaginase [Oscillospiraceae bacterium]|nr:asparaginase [Oscillospiraceae bacterium]
MKRILLLTTGGTIASKESAAGRVAEYTGEDLTRDIPELAGLCEIQVRDVMNLDSTNMQPEDWKVIAKETYEGLKSFEGIVITHGTDTMAYTSAMLSFMLKNLHKPVVLTGSQLSVDEPNTDAKKNLVDAVKTAAAGYPGVYVVFGGKIIKGTRACKAHSTDFGAFESVNAPLAGRIIDDKVCMENPLAQRTSETLLEMGTDSAGYPGVFLLKIIPGTSPKVIDEIVKMDNYRGIVIEAYGIGGVPNARRDLIEPIKRAIHANMSVVVITQCRNGTTDLTRYEVGKSVLKEGVITVGDMTAEAAVTKLMWLLDQLSDPREIKKKMQENFCDEIG